MQNLSWALGQLKRGITADPTLLKPVGAYWALER